MIPEVMNFPPGFKHSLACGINGTIISAKMLATIKSTFLLIPSSKLFVPILMSCATGFKATFSFVALIASSSMSYASISPAPRYFAAILKTPEPVPTSIIDSLPRISFSSAKRASLVVGCVPVPNARPGSSQITFSSAFSGW